MINKLSFFILSLILLISCEEKQAEPQKINDTKEYLNTPDQISWDVQVCFIDSNYTKAILKAKRGRIYQVRQETFLDSGVHVDFLSRSTRTTESVLTSDSARIDDRTKNMTATGHVVVISLTKNVHLETTVLNWDNKTQKLYSKEFVTIKSPHENLQGWGFESDQNLSYYKIFKVSGEQK